MAGFMDLELRRPVHGLQVDNKWVTRGEGCSCLRKAGRARRESAGQNDEEDQSSGSEEERSAKHKDFGKVTREECTVFGVLGKAPGKSRLLENLRGGNEKLDEDGFSTLVKSG